MDQLDIARIRNAYLQTSTQVVVRTLNRRLLLKQGSALGIAGLALAGSGMAFGGVLAQDASPEASPARLATDPFPQC